MERVMSELANYFCRIPDIELHIILYGKDPKVYYEIPYNLILHKPESEFNERMRFLSAIRRIFYLRRTIRSINPDSILSFGEYWNSFVLLSIIGLDYPVYISDRCSPAKQFGNTHHFLRKLLYRRAAGVIAQTAKAQSLYSNQFINNNIRVIGNPIRMISCKNKKIEREKIILTVGRLIRTKHHDILIRLFSEVSEEGWRLVIVGDNALKEDTRSALEQLVDSLGMTDRIILAGNIKDVDTYYCRSQIFAFTSSSEGFPNVIGEAMSAGLPVIAFNCIAGPEELIRDGETGYLVDLFDNDTFRDRLRKLMNDHHLRSRMGAAGMKVIEDYASEKIGQRYLDFILTN